LVGRYMEMPRFLALEDVAATDLRDRCPRHDDDGEQ
jgi:hypothetical protein